MAALGRTETLHVGSYSLSESIIPCCEGALDVITPAYTMSSERTYLTAYSKRFIKITGLLKKKQQEVSVFVQTPSLVPKYDRK